MLIKYIVLSESNHYGWVGGFTTLKEAKKMLKIETETFYIFKHVHKKTEPFQMKKEVFEEDDDSVINTPDDTCDNGSLILTHKPYMEKVNQNVVLKKETIKAIELRKNDMCIIQDKIYKITAIWLTPELIKNGLHNR